MSAEANKALERRLFGELNKGKANLTAAMALIDEFYATDIVRHRSNGEEIRGIENYKQFINKTVSNDFHATIEDMIAEGDKVAIRYTWTAPDKATNKKVTGWQIDIDHIVDGKIVESSARSDTLGTAQQLGRVPTPQEK